MASTTRVDANGTQPTLGYVLGLHIGASSCHAGILSNAGDVICKFDYRETLESKRLKTYEEVLDETIAAAVKVIGDSGIAGDNLVGAGVVVPVPAYSETGYVLRSTALQCLKAKHLGADLKRKFFEETGFQLDFLIENDANGACLSEWYFGMGQKETDFMVVSLSSGLGGAMILNGKLYRGASQIAGEIGHITVQPNGRRCGCGSRGCLETVASGQALLHAVRELRMDWTKRSDLTYLDLIGVARDNHPELRDLFTTMGEYLGIGLASIINVLNPSRVVLCGPLAAGHSLFGPAAEDQLALRVFTGMECEVIPTTQLNDMEIRSALSAFLYSRGVRP